MFLQTKFIKYLSILICSLCILFLIFWFSLINAPYDSDFAALFHPVLYAPRELLFLCFTLFSLSALFIKKKSGLLFIFIFNAILYSQLDFRIAIPDTAYTSTDSTTIKFISFNMGASKRAFDRDRFTRWIGTINNLSFMVFQEARKSNLGKLLGKKWNLECASYLCIASPYKITLIKSQSRRALGGWGSFAAHFQITIDNQLINIFNLHLETIRKGIEHLIGTKLRGGYKELKNNHYNRKTEARIASTLVKSYNNSIILGDFNTVNVDPIYQQYWSSFQNAFDSKGNGFGYTKQTRWHGLRIDHILTSKEFSILNYQTGPFLKGDHLPILAEISFL